MKFTEAKLEQAIIALLGEQGFPHVTGDTLTRSGSNGAPAPLNDSHKDAAGATSLPGVLIKDDLRKYLSKQYAADSISEGEINAVISQLESYPAADLYGSNKAIMKLVCDGFQLKREDHTKKDLWENVAPAVLLTIRTRTELELHPPRTLHKKTLQLVKKHANK